MPRARGRTALSRLASGPVTAAPSYEQHKLGKPRRLCFGDLKHAQQRPTYPVPVVVGLLCSEFFSIAEAAKKKSMSDACFHCRCARSGAGLLRVLDLAGSERNFETVAHTRAMASRGATINASLLHLKDCLRIRHQNLAGGKEHVPRELAARRAKGLSLVC